MSNTKELLQKCLDALKVYSTASDVHPTGNRELIVTLGVALAQQEKPSQEPVAFITTLMEQQMFDDWCPYKGSPDPRVVWAAAIDAANGLLLQPPTQPALTQEQAEKLAHRRATTYTHRSDPNFTAYAFTPLHLMDFVRDIEAHCRGGAK